MCRVVDLRIDPERFDETTESTGQINSANDERCFLDLCLTKELRPGIILVLGFF